MMLSGVYPGKTDTRYKTLAAANQAAMQHFEQYSTTRSRRQKGTAPTTKMAESESVHLCKLNGECKGDDVGGERVIRAIP